MNDKILNRSVVLGVALAAALSMAGAMAWSQPMQPVATQSDGPAGVVTPQVAPEAPSAPAAPVSPPAEILHRLLAGDRDARMLSELAEQRNRVLRTDANALDALARGLRVYLVIGPALAADPLATAAANPNVYALTVGVPEPLDKLAIRCRAAATTKPRSYGPTGPCYKCGDTRQMPCTRCAGSGHVTCTKCSGAGVIYGPDALGRSRPIALCDQCGGSGVVDCKVCGGTGTVECTACKPKPNQAAAANLPAGQVREFRKVICKARWLRAGGVDLYTNGAREPSPK